MTNANPNQPGGTQVPPTNPAAGGPNSPTETQQIGTGDVASVASVVGAPSSAKPGAGNAARTVARTVQPSAPRPVTGYTAPAGEANPTPIQVECPACGQVSGIMAPETPDYADIRDHLAAVLRQPEDVVTIKVECGNCGSPFFIEHPDQPAEEDLPAAYLSEVESQAAADGVDTVRGADVGVAGDRGR